MMCPRPHLHIAVWGSHANHGPSHQWSPAQGTGPGGGPDGQRRAALDGAGCVWRAAALAAALGNCTWRLGGFLCGFGSCPSNWDITKEYLRYMAAHKEMPAFDFELQCCIALGQQLLNLRVRSPSQDNLFTCDDQSSLHDSASRKSCTVDQQQGISNPHLCVRADR